MWSLKRFSGIGFESGDGELRMATEKEKARKIAIRQSSGLFLCGFFDDLASKVLGGTIAFHSGDLDIGGQPE